MKKIVHTTSWLLLFLVLCLNVTNLIALANSTKDISISGNVTYTAPETSSALQVQGNSTDGYYIEMGEYPTTFAGYVSSTSYTETNEKFTLADGTEYTVYTDTDDNRYIQYTANSYSTSYYYSDYTNTTTKVATYFKLEPIKWDVLGVYTAGATTQQTSTKSLTAYTGQELSDGQQLVLQSRLGLEAMAWNTDYEDSSINYKTSEIYTYLSKFYTNVLSDYSSNIVARTIDYNTTANYSSLKGGYNDNYTTENVWLLSYDEASTWYSSSTERYASPSDFALATYAYMYTSTSYTTCYRESGGTCYWWIRSSYFSNYFDVVYAGCVNNLGGVYDDYVDSAYFCVRPAMLVTL